MVCHFGEPHAASGGSVRSASNVSSRRSLSPAAPPTHRAASAHGKATEPLSIALPEALVSRSAELGGAAPTPNHEHRLQPTSTPPPSSPIMTYTHGAIADGHRVSI